MISFIIPAKNEEASVEKLTHKIVSVLNKIKKDYEIIFIDDGSTDSTYSEIIKLTKLDKNVKIIRHRGNLGKSVALQNGFDMCLGEIIFTIASRSGS